MTEDHERQDQRNPGPDPSKPVKAELLVVRSHARRALLSGVRQSAAPIPVDYFTFFGLPYNLNLDTAQLERDFYALSRQLHPDINARSSDPEQEWSLEKSRNSTTRIGL